MNPNDELLRRLDDLHQRSLNGDREALTQALNLATNSLKSVQQSKAGPAAALRRQLEAFLAKLHTSGTGQALRAEKGSRELQRDDLNQRVLAGDLAAVEQAALTTFGRGTLEWSGRKLQGSLGIVFQCCLLFIEEQKAGRRIHILAPAGGLGKVETKGLFSKKTVLTLNDGQACVFDIDRKRSTADEARRHDDFANLWTGLGL